MQFKPYSKDCSDWFLSFHVLLWPDQFSSVANWCPTLCDPMDCSTPGFPVFQPSSGVCSNSSPLNQGCHPTISSSVIPFSCHQSFPASVFSNELALCIRWPKYFISFFHREGHLLGPAVTRAPPPAFPRNPRGRLGFPGPTQGEG